jgi:hypothetical protein
MSREQREVGAMDVNLGQLLFTELIHDVVTANPRRWLLGRRHHRFHVVACKNFPVAQ